MLTLIKSLFIDYKLTILRNKKTPNSLFRQTMNETSYLIAAEVLKHLKYKQTSIQTPLTKTKGKDLSKSVVIVPILRAGLGLVEGFVKLLPDAEKVTLAYIETNKHTSQLSIYSKYQKLKIKFLLF